MLTDQKAKKIIWEASLYVEPKKKSFTYSCDCGERWHSDYDFMKVAKYSGSYFDQKTEQQFERFWCPVCGKVHNIAI